MQSTELPFVGSVVPEGYIKLCGTPLCKPKYGWNLFRRLLRKPLYWKVTYHFKMTETNGE